MYIIITHARELSFLCIWCSSIFFSVCNWKDKLDSWGWWTIPQFFSPSVSSIDHGDQRGYIEVDFDFRSLQFAMPCWYQVVRFMYLIAQFFVVFQQGPLLEVVEVRNNRGQELVTRVSGYSGPMHYVTFSFSLAICCSSSCVCQNKSRPGAYQLGWTVPVLSYICSSFNF